MSDQTPDKPKNQQSEIPLSDAQLDEVSGGVNRTIAPPKPPAPPAPPAGGGS